MIIKASRNLGHSIEPTCTNLIDVPRQTSFHVPAGTYPAIIRSVSIKHRQAGSSSIPFVRSVFSVQVPGATVDYLAKFDLKLDLNEGSELWSVLCRLLSRKALQDASGGKFDLNTLIGLPCDLEIEHITDRQDDYEFPLVVVTNVQPARTLICPVEGEN